MLTVEIIHLSRFLQELLGYPFCFCLQLFQGLRLRRYYRNMKEQNRPICETGRYAKPNVSFLEISGTNVFSLFRELGQKRFFMLL